MQQVKSTYKGKLSVQCYKIYIKNKIQHNFMVIINKLFKNFVRIKYLQ